MANPLPTDGTVDVGPWLSEERPPADQSVELFISAGAAASVPLRHRTVHTTMHCDLGFEETTEELTYLADADCSVGFKFPLPPRSAVFRFEATIGDRVVKTKTKRKSEAVAEYNTAMQQGHTAVIAKQETHSIFSVDLGNLEAHTEAVVRLSYLRQLDRVAGAVEFCHTATWVPPYTGSAGDRADGTDKILAGNPRFAQKVAYKLSYRVCIEAAVGVKDVTCASHGSAARIDLEASPPTVTLSEEVSDPSKDFTLLVELGSAASEVLRSRLALQEAERDGGTKTTAMATFVPRLAEAPPAILREVWLVVDGSGSMSGLPTEQARDAALFFVKDLPHGQDVKFNVVVFGSNWCFMSDACQDYTEETAAAAVAWVQTNVHANWGGTEIGGTLDAIYKTPISDGYTRELLFLTDGGVSGHEEERILNLVSGGSKSMVKQVMNKILGRGQRARVQMTGATHVFCLGIGFGVHRPFLDGIAQRSGGVAQYVVDGEDVALKAGYLKKCALSTGALLRPTLISRDCLLRPAPAVLPPVLFPDEPVTVLAEVVQTGQHAAMELQYTTYEGDVISIPLEFAAVEPSKGDALAVLHAMCYVGALLGGTSQLHLKPDGSAAAPAPDADVVKDEIVRAAVAENLVTPHTASVGILLQSNPLDASKIEKHEVPLQVPHGRTMWAEDPPQPGFSAPLGGGGPLMSSRCAPASMKSVARFRLPAAFTAMSMPPAAPSPPASPAQASFGSVPCPAPGGAFGAPRAAPAAFSAGPAAAVGNGGGIGLTAGFAAAPAPPPFATPSSLGMPPPPSPLLAMPDAASQPADGTRQGMDMAAGAAVAGSGALDDRGALRLLNQLRTTEGSWALTDQLLALLVSRRGATHGSSPNGAEELKTSAPEGVGEAEWATLLVTAFLRKRVGGERALWSAMEAKAVAWLTPRWAPAGGASLGAATIAAMKLL